MGYGVVIDVPASWEVYERVAEELGSPPELIAHAAGRTDEGFRILDVWQSERAWQAFTERLLPRLESEVDIAAVVVRGHHVEVVDVSPPTVS